MAELVEQPDAAAAIEEPYVGPLASFFDTDTSIPRYVLRMGLVSLIPSLLISMILSLTGIISEENMPKFEGPALAVLVGIILVSPLVETLLMSLVLKILSLVVRKPLLLAGLSALVWAGLHSLATPVWGLGVVWPFFVFSCAYLAWRRKSWCHAVGVTCLIHMFQNVIPGLAVLASL